MARSGLLWLFFVGCSGTAGEGSPTSELPGTVDTQAPTRCVEAQLGAAGGAIQGDGIRLEVPADALTSERLVSICEVPAPDGAQPLGAAWSITGGGGALALDVAATLVLEGSEPDAALFVPDPGGTPQRSLQAHAPSVGTLQGPLYRGGIVFAALDDRQIEPYTSGADGIDVLFVVDDSNSMYDDQRQLAGAFEDALPAWLASGVDFRVGVVSTDMDNPNRRGHLRELGGTQWLDRDTPQLAARFEELALVGTSGSWTEQGLGAAYTALELLADTDNAGFQRFDASLAVVVVSDEDDQTREGLITVSEFIDWLPLRAEPAVASLHAIVMSPTGSFPEYAGERYAEVAEATGGLVEDIESDDWSAVFDRILADSPSDAGMVLPGIEPGSVEAWWVPPAAEPQSLDVFVDSASDRVIVEAGDVPTDEIVLLYLPR